MNYIRRRCLWVGTGYLVVSLGVLALCVQRLSEPMGDVHRSKIGQGAVITPNPYRGVAGGVFSPSGRRVLLDRHGVLDAHTTSSGKDLTLRELVGSRDLSEALEPALRRGVTDFVRDHGASGGQRAGRRLLLTLDPQLQAQLQRDARCFTGSVADCTDLPSTLADADVRLRDASHGPRAGMAAVVVVDEDTGAVKAMSGAVSGCTAGNLRRKVQQARGSAPPIFRLSSEPCSQFPDARHGELIGLRINQRAYASAPAESDLAQFGLGLARPPALWSLQPGSTAKIGVVAGCVTTGKLNEPLDVVRAKLAASTDNAWARSLAIRCAEGYRAIYRAYSNPQDLLLPAGVLPRSSEFAGWTTQVLPAELPRGPLVPSGSFLALDEAMHGPARGRPRLSAETFARLQRSRDLAAMAIGGGGHQATLFAHVRTLRALGLTSRGLTTAPVMHLTRDLDEPLPDETHGWIDDERQVLTVLDLLADVTARGGTAHLACKRVEGACPGQGLGLSGKTGTADFAAAPGSDRVKTGERFPAKLAVLRFEVGGRWYVAAAHVFRTRDPVTQRLDETNAAAELVLLARQRMAGGGR